jgi:CBS-domain-containing membrane protein
MSPRAAWRLESLGFADVYDYVGGKVDWFGAGWPREGAPPGIVRLIDLVDRSVPACSLQERVGEVRDRLGDWEICIVTNNEGVVLGVVERDALTGDDGLVAEVMRPSPSTSRPHVSMKQAAAQLDKHPRPLVVLTEPDGRLVGVVRAEDVIEAARRGAGTGVDVA